MLQTAVGLAGKMIKCAPGFSGFSILSKHCEESACVESLYVISILAGRV